MLSSKCLGSVASKRGAYCFNQKILKNAAISKRIFWSRRRDNEEPKSFEVVIPGEVTPSECPPSGMLPSRIPNYIFDPKEADYDQMRIQNPTVWTEEEIDKIRGSCQIASKLLHKVKDLATPGTTTEAIDAEIQDQIMNHEKAYPSLLGFKGFPKGIATSVNNIAVHGVPDDRPLKPGDIINVDVAVYKGGYHGLCARTFVVGNTTDKSARHLVTSAYECLQAGLSVCGPGVPFSFIGSSVAKMAKKRRVGIASALVGHGIGSFFHGIPDIIHVPNGYPGTMKPGMIFTIEPCVTEGLPSVEILEDGFTISTRDKMRAAQFEHTVLITDTGVEILSML